VADYLNGKKNKTLFVEMLFGIVNVVQLILVARDGPATFNFVKRFYCGCVRTTTRPISVLKFILVFSFISFLWNHFLFLFRFRFLETNRFSFYKTKRSQFRFYFRFDNLFD